MDVKENLSLGDLLTCGLNNDELKLLKYLYIRRNFASNRAQHIEKIRRSFHGKINVDKTIKSLLNKRYVGRIHKGGGDKYYCKAGITIKALGLHGLLEPGSEKSR